MQDKVSAWFPNYFFFNSESCSGSFFKIQNGSKLAPMLKLCKEIQEVYLHKGRQQDTKPHDHDWDPNLSSELWAAIDLCSRAYIPAEESKPISPASIQDADTPMLPGVNLDSKDDHRIGEYTGLNGISREGLIKPPA